MDYTKSLQKGLAAFQIAEEARQELTSAVEKLSQDMQSLTDGRLQLFLRPATKSVPVKNFSLFANYMMPLEHKTVEYLALVCKNPKDARTQTEEVCELTLSKEGYPMYLRWRGRSTSAQNRESLEATFAEMIEDPDVMSILKRTMDRAS